MSAEERRGHPPGLPEDSQAVLSSKALTLVLPQASPLQGLPQGAPQAQRALLTCPRRGAVPAPGTLRTDTVLGAGVLHSTAPTQPASEGILFPNMELATSPPVGQVGQGAPLSWGSS